MQMMASWLFPFISFLIAVIDPEHILEQQYPHCGWGLTLAVQILRPLCDEGTALLLTQSRSLSGSRGREGVPPWAGPLTGEEA